MIFLAMDFFKNDVFLHESPTVEIVEPIQEKRPVINYNDKIFSVAIEDDFANAYYDPLIFEVQMSNIYLSIEDGDIYKYLKNSTMIFHICTEEDFPDNMYHSQGFKNNLCLNKSSFRTEGFWDENFFTYLEIDVILCNNATSGGKCKTPEEIQEFFYSKYFNVYYTSNSLVSNNLEHPLESLVSNDFSQIDMILRKSMHIYLKNIQIHTDDGFLITNDKIINDVIFDSKDTDQFLVTEITDERPIFQCYFYSSRKNQNVKRKYQKILEALSNLGGTANIVMILGFILTSMEKSLDLKRKMMNSLFSFQDFQQIEKRKSIKKNINEEKDNKGEIEVENFSENIENKENNFDISIDSTQRKRAFSDKIVIKELPEENEIQKEICNESQFLNSPAVLISNTLKVFPIDSKEEIIQINKEKDPEILVKTEPRLKNTFLSFKMNSKVVTSITKLKNKDEKKRERMQSIDKFEEFMNNPLEHSKLTFSFFEFVKLRIKQFFKKSLSDKEILFEKGVEYHDKELDIVSILKKIQEIEKLKIILFNEEQTTLFNLLDKPLVYLDENNEENNENDKSLRMDASKRMTKLLHSNTYASRLQLKKIFEHFEMLEKKSQLTEIDRRLMSLVNENLAKFANNFA